MDLDLEFVRAQFPGLGDDCVLADNAGGSVPCVDVVDAMHEFMTSHMVQLGASYPRSVAAGEAVDAGRAAAARLVGGAPHNVVLTGSTTLSMKTLARSLAPSVSAGDEVIVTNLDHEANVGAWRSLAAQGVVIREWAFDPATAMLTLEGLEPLLNERTRLVAFTHAANVVGAIHDVRAMTDRIRDAGALSVVDGVAYAPHRRVDVEALGCDVYALSLYKVFGPHEGLLWARQSVHERARSQNHFFHPETMIPGKLEPGNVCFETTASLVGITQYLRRVAEHHGVASTGDPLDAAFGLFAAHEAVLAERLLAYLRTRDDVTIVGPSSSDVSVRVPTIAFTMRGRNAEEAVLAADAAGIGIRFGHFYAYRAIEAMGLADSGGVTRVSLLHYNTVDEVDRIIAVLDGLEAR